jgi:hypothetical protein
VVSHQDIRPDLDFIAFAHQTEEADELLMVSVIFIDGPTLNSSIQDMIETPWKVQSEGPCHDILRGKQRLGL